MSTIGFPRFAADPFAPVVPYVVRRRVISETFRWLHGTRTMMRAGVPMLPAVSRHWRTSRVSPVGNASVRLTVPPVQNSTVDAVLAKVGLSSLPKIQGSKVLLAKRHPKSLSASVTSGELGSKSGGSKPGTPPSLGGVVSQTAALPNPAPEPRSRLERIWKSGRAPGALVNWLCPGDWPLEPGFASATMKKPVPSPAGCW